MPISEKLKKIQVYHEKLGLLNIEMEAAGRTDRLKTGMALAYLRDLYDLYSDLEREQAEEKAVVQAPAEAPAGYAVVNAPIEKIDTPAVEQPPRVEEPVARVEVASTASGNGSGSVKGGGAPKEASANIVSLMDKYTKDLSKDDVNRKSGAGKKLTELIPLNDKFMFIMEFFENSISRYESAISDIDKLASRTEALDYMQNNAWTSGIIEKEPELIERFIRIIDLKYPEG